MPVGLEEEICSHCRTPRDDMEMEEGRALVRREEARRKRRPKLIAAGVAAGVLLAAAWLLRGLVLGPLLVAWSDFQIEVEKTRQPSHWLKGKPPLVAPAAPASSAVSAAVPDSTGRVVVSSFVYLDPGGPAGARAEAPASDQPPAVDPAHASAFVQTPLAAPETPPDPALTLGPGELLVQGMVYDLATRRPVGGVRVKFQQRRGDAAWAATTNAEGRYHVGVYKNATDAIVVMIEAPGYRKGLLEDRDPPYRERSVQARTDLIAETTESDLEPVPLRHRESARTVDLDLVLVPEAKIRHE